MPWLRNTREGESREKLKEITLVIMSYILNFRLLATSLPPNFWFTSYYKPLGSLVEKKRNLLPL